jgi:hypothetical protein
MNAKTTKSIWFIAVAALGTAGTCAAQTPASEAPARLDKVGATLPVADFRVDALGRDALGQRASRIATLMQGATVTAVSAEKAPVQDDGKPVERGEFFVESSKRIAISFDAQRNELLAVQGAVADDYLSGTDVGPKEARAVFERTIGALESAKLVQPEGLELDTVHTGRRMQGEMGPDRKENKRIKAYFFEIPRAIAGIEVFGSSTTVSVHRTGEVESIRSIGPGALRTQETLKRRISPQSLLSRARKENPRAEVSRVGLRYPWTAAREDAALASRPRETFRVVPIATVDGQRIEGRSYYVFYAVDDKKLAPIVWPKPNPQATGDVRKEVSRE